MALNGTGTRLVSTVTHAAGHPGGSYQVTIHAVPVGSYPALGEPIAALLTAAGELVKVAAGVLPDNVFISTARSESVWDWDPVQGTLRAFTALTPTEHATGVYSATELASALRITMFFPLMGSTSR